MQTIQANAAPAKAGTLGISHPPIPTDLGAYDYLNHADPACSDWRIPADTCGDCCKRSSVFLIEYGGEEIGACEECVPDLCYEGAVVLKRVRR